jgi:hypothetical protein
VSAIDLERLRLLDVDLDQQQTKAERLHHLDRLLLDLLRHHHQVHDVLVLIYLSILVFMLDMLVIALATANNTSWLHQLVIIVFLVGIGILLVGMVLMAAELRTSHHSIQLAVGQNCRLCKPDRHGNNCGDSLSERLRQR